MDEGCVGAQENDLLVCYEKCNIPYFCTMYARYNIISGDPFCTIKNQVLLMSYVNSIYILTDIQNS